MVCACACACVCCGLEGPLRLKGRPVQGAPCHWPRVCGGVHSAKSCVFFHNSTHPGRSAELFCCAIDWGAVKGSEKNANKSEYVPGKPSPAGSSEAENSGAVTLGFFLRGWGPAAPCPQCEELYFPTNPPSRPRRFTTGTPLRHPAHPFHHAPHGERGGNGVPPPARPPSALVFRWE